MGPEFPLLPISEQTGLIAHHVLHVALRHCARRDAARERYGQSFKTQLFDLACDAMVNEALLQARHALPRPAVRAADIIARLPAEERPQNVLAEWDCDTLYTAMAAHSSGRGTGDENTFQQYAQAQGFEPDLKGAPSEQAEPEIWASRVEQALLAGQQAGSGIGAVLARFGDLPKSIVPWEIRLRRLLNKALAQQPIQTHRRPSRGWLARDAHARQSGGYQPCFEPAYRQDLKQPKLVIGLDTSSSIRDATLDMFASEAVSITRRTSAEVHLLGFDTDIHSRTRLTNAQDLYDIDLKKGGGTDFGPILAEAQTLSPSMIIVLTDLDAPTAHQVSAPLIWAVPEPPSSPPHCGEVLVMQDVN